MPILSHFPSGGTDTRDATAAAADIASGKTAYVNEQKVTGTSTKEYGIGDTINMLQISKSVNVGTISRTYYADVVHPIFYIDQNYVYMYHGTTLSKFGRSTGNLVWSINIGLSNFAYICANDNYVYLATPSQIYSYNQADGSLKTSISAGYNIAAWFIADNNGVYYGRQGSPFTVTCINPITLAFVWSYMPTQNASVYDASQDASYVYIIGPSYLTSLSKASGSVNLNITITNGNSVRTTNLETHLYTEENGVYRQRNKLDGSIVWSTTNTVNVPVSISDTLPFVFVVPSSAENWIASLQKSDGSLVEEFSQIFNGVNVYMYDRLGQTFDSYVYVSYYYAYSGTNYYCVLALNAYSVFSINS